MFRFSKNFLYFSDNYTTTKTTFRSASLFLGRGSSKDNPFLLKKQVAVVSEPPLEMYF
jgi:hypothetical protein